jgi:hypothetical protein
VQLGRHTRLIALIILATVTVWGLRELAAGDWEAVVHYWRGSPLILPVALLWSVVEVVLEGCAWMWVYTRLGVPVRSAAGFAAYLSGRAGLLLPAQLGRLVRPDSVSSIGRAPLKTCLKAEAVAFVIDVASVVALLAALLAFRIHPLAAPVALLGVLVGVAGLGDWFTGRLLHRALRFPPGFWWRWQTGATLLLQMSAWIAYGMVLWTMVGRLPSDLTPWDAIFYSSGSSLLGVSTGLPAGIGATEVLLGVSLRFEELGADFMVMVIAAFRVVTLWIWIPIGWLALAWVRRRAVAHSAASVTGTSSAS